MTSLSGPQWAHMMIAAQVNLPGGHLSSESISVSSGEEGQLICMMGDITHYPGSWASDLLFFVSITWSRQHRRSGLHTAHHCTLESVKWDFLLDFESTTQFIVHPVHHYIVLHTLNLWPGSLKTGDWYQIHSLYCCILGIYDMGLRDKRLMRKSLSQTDLDHPWPES